MLRIIVCMIGFFVFRVIYDEILIPPPCSDPAQLNQKVPLI